MSREWHLPGVTEVNYLQDTAITIPAAGGAGTPILSIQQAGFLSKLRGYLQAQVVQTAGTGAPVKSPWGALGGSVRRLQATVAGRKPFFSLSGLGLTYYNEVSNPDGSVLAPPAYLSAAGEVVIAEAAHLTEHDATTTGAVNYDVRQPFELNFGLPVWMARLIGLGKDFIPVETKEEVGLWYLQERKTSLNVDMDFYAALATSPLSPYSGGTGVAATWSTTINHVRFERELFDVPPDLKAWPDQAFVHQVVEHEATIAGSAFHFPIPQSGSMLRAIFIFLDGSNVLVEWSDILNLSMSYGANDKPIDRPGWPFVNDFLHDYGRYPPKGCVVMDFYKAGREAARLARDTDRIANLSFDGLMSATATGKVKIIIESLVPQVIPTA